MALPGVSRALLDWYDWVIIVRRTFALNSTMLHNMCMINSQIYRVSLRKIIHSELTFRWSCEGVTTPQNALEFTYEIKSTCRSSSSWRQIKKSQKTLSQCYSRHRESIRVVLSDTVRLFLLDVWWSAPASWDGYSNSVNTFFLPLFE